MYWIIGAIALVGIVAGIWMVLRGGGGDAMRFRPGTRAFEAHLTLDPLRITIAQTKKELETADPSKRDRLARELAYLEKQVPELEAIGRRARSTPTLSPSESIVAANDGSPGLGYVGFKRLPPGK